MKYVPPLPCDLSKFTKLLLQGISGKLAQQDILMCRLQQLPRHVNQALAGVVDGLGSVPCQLLLFATHLLHHLAKRCY